ncbi:L-2-hydroxyglutarate oxidase [Arthrobacter sp. AG367]|uniref:L-2-hydroxyglutarate oxidase n=1 Tax=Arthrobacter sp. AG367 TaxID=2572909 RepID=UPI0011A32796|nr:L-2-hydroxyglutarate oxidase [Arthrobacter sp. AG367]TWD47059.1 L-2-hydroxyglutarate oxidase [Arthrobacter sp. AG367]
MPTSASANTENPVYDYAVIGGGIVGVATAWQLLQRFPNATVVLFEKEIGLAKHQTGHNSGVIHAGIYYEPGSLKAEFCRIGAAWTKQFATAHGIAFEECGKLLVATNAIEMERMDALAERARVNGIRARKLTQIELRAEEPNVSGLGALLIEDTGIIDYREVTEAVAREATERGARILLRTEVRSIDEQQDFVDVRTNRGLYRTRKVIACAGLQSDRVARMAGLDNDFQIMPFRGEYYDVVPGQRSRVRRLIYPIPDPDLPFLGVHLSPTIDGGLTVGPNAVLGLAREKYGKFSVSRRDVWEMLTFPALWKVAMAHLRTGAAEIWNSINKRAYLQRARKYAPKLRMSDLVPREAGIRAQAVMRDGKFQHDFLIRQTTRTVHVLNAPSPAATSAMPIAQHIVQTAVDGVKGQANQQAK